MKDSLFNTRLINELSRLNDNFERLIKIEETRATGTSRARVERIKRKHGFTPMQLRVLGFIYDHQNDIPAITADLYAKMQETDSSLFPKSLSTLRSYLSILYSTGVVKYIHDDNNQPYWKVDTDKDWVKEQIEQYHTMMKQE